MSGGTATGSTAMTELVGLEPFRYKWTVEYTEDVDEVGRGHSQYILCLEVYDGEKRYEAPIPLTDAMHQAISGVLQDAKAPYEDRMLQELHKRGWRTL